MLSHRVRSYLTVALVFVVIFLVSIDQTTAFSTAIHRSIISATSARKYDVPSLISSRRGPLLSRASVVQHSIASPRLSISPTASNAVATSTAAVAKQLVSTKPPLVLKPFHFVHPTGMSLGLASLSLAGLYYGLTIKWARRAAKKGEKKYTLMQVKQARDWHPRIMTAIMGLYGAGSIGGIVTMLSLKQPLFQSDHTKTALVTFGLLLSQFQISKKLIGAPEYLKKVHSGLGMLTMFLMATHGVMGLKLLASLWEQTKAIAPAVLKSTSQPNTPQLALSSA